MKLSEQQFISAPLAKVYDALNDAEILRQCIPGCEELTKKSDTEMAAKVTLKIGPLKASFTGEVTLSNLNPPHGYTISGQGSGSAGGAKGSADVSLKEKDGGTMLTYAVDVQMNGKIAQLGSRLIDATAKKLSAQFFEKFAACLGPTKTPDAADDAAPAGDTPPPAKAGGVNKIAVAGAVIIVAIIAALLLR